jgi:tRNA(fMet)-specific endonuclease VapC
MFLFDTDHITFLQVQIQPEHGRMVHRMSLYRMTAFFWSIVSFDEQTLGAHALTKRTQDPKSVLRGYGLFEVIRSSFAIQQVLPFDQAGQSRFVQWQGLRSRVATKDLRIAAIALAHNLTVLTRNQKHFSKVPGLQTEDWTL